MIKNKLNKKGAFTDIIIFAIFSFVIVVVIVLLNFVAIETKERLNEQSSIPSQTVNDTMGKVVESYNVLKWGSYLMIFAMILAIFIANFLTQAHPVFFVPYIFVVVIAVVISAPLANVYEQLYTDPTLGPTFHSYVGSSYIILNLPIWVAIVGVMGGIFLFVRLFKDQGEGNQIG